MTFSFDLSGNQRVGGSDDFQAGFTFGSSTFLTSYFVGGAFGNSTFGINFNVSGLGVAASTSGNAVQTYVFGFTAGQAGTFSARLSSINSNDNVGAIADNLNLSSTGAVPEPATWAMMILGFGAAGSMIRRRRALTA